MGGSFGTPQPLAFQVTLSLEDFYNGKDLEVELQGGRPVKIKIEPGIYKHIDIVAHISPVCFYYFQECQVDKN